MFPLLCSLVIISDPLCQFKGNQNCQQTQLAGGQNVDRQLTANSRRHHDLQWEQVTIRGDRRSDGLLAQAYFFFFFLPYVEVQKIFLDKNRGWYSGL